jgi:uncharacterized membrane protein YccF (DUF307 family)
MRYVAMLSQFFAAIILGVLAGIALSMSEIILAIICTLIIVGLCVSVATYAIPNHSYKCGRYTTSCQKQCVHFVRK